MTIRHAEVFPEGTSPDSIDWRIWNAPHVGAGGPGGSQSLQDTIDIGNVWQIAGDTEPRIEFGDDGALYFGDGTDPPDVRFWKADPEGDFAGVFLGVLPFGFLFGSEDTFSQSTTLEFKPTSHFQNNLVLRVPDATVDDADNHPGFVFSGTHWNGSASERFSATWTMDLTETFWTAKVAELFFVNGKWDFDADGNMIWTGPAGSSAVIATAPTTDPGVEGKLFTMDAAGLAAALGAGARYALISGGP